MDVEMGEARALGGDGTGRSLGNGDRLPAGHFEWTPVYPDHSFSLHNHDQNVDLVVHMFRDALARFPDEEGRVQVLRFQSPLRPVGGTDRRWVEHGLLSSLDEAVSDRRHADVGIPEHAPFMVVAIYLLSSPTDLTFVPRVTDGSVVSVVS